MNENLIRYRYLIEFDEGQTLEFDIPLDAKSLDNRLNLGPPPCWSSRRDFGCRNPACPLAEEDRCPCACTTHYLVGVFGNIPSTQQVTITATTSQRSCTRRAAIQTAVGSITGILMATCGCPVLARLKPMARFHLPFASVEETEYRIFAMYALAQVLRARRHLEWDCGFEGLRDLYAQIQAINRLSADKIAAAQQKDAAINGLVILDTFAQMVALSLDTNDTSEIEEYFADWLKSS